MFQRGHMKLSYSISIGFALISLALLISQPTWAKENVSEYSDSTVEVQREEESSSEIISKKGNETQGRSHPKNDWLGM
jgi:hypothetical protein